jgi:hypothetical protein
MLGIFTREKRYISAMVYHGLPVDILFPKNCGSIVLIEEDCIFLIQKGGESTSPDTTLSMLCTRVSAPKDEEFFFELNVFDPVDGRKGTFSCHLRSVVDEVTSETDLVGVDSSLTVPQKFYAPNGDIDLTVLIEKYPVLS